MHIEIIYEDEFLLVVNKPYGIVVNRADSVKVETVQDWMEKRSAVIPSDSLTGEESSDPQQAGNDFYNRSGIVHRLDKETSGCLIIAKTPEAFFKLQAVFKERLVKKEYIALAHGKLEPKEGEINAPVGRLPWNRERFGVTAGGKEAYTRYSVVSYFSDKVVISSAKYSLVHLFPTTGRTHQIRVHLKYLGHPIVGDYLYAGRKQQIKDRVWCPRVFLHAAKISFPHPVTGVEITAEAPLAEELQKVLNNLELSQ